MDIEKLQRLIARIDELMPEELAENGLYMTYEEFKAHQRKLDAVVQRLVEEEAAKRGQSSGADTLTMAGIRTSSTGASRGLLRNWQAAARRHIQREGGR